jgi:hypothetical protein
VFREHRNGALLGPAQSEGVLELDGGPVHELHPHTLERESDVLGWGGQKDFVFGVGAERLVPHQGQKAMLTTELPPSWTMRPNSPDLSDRWTSASGQENRSGCLSHWFSAQCFIDSQQCAIGWGVRPNVRANLETTA